MIQQFETAQFLPAGIAHRPVGGARLLRALRRGQEWPAMEGATGGDTINPWASPCSAA